MNDSNYEDLLADLQQSMGGIGPSRIESIREEFPEGDDFVDACRDAYETRDTTALERIEGIGHGYAIGKLAFFMAERRGWEGGDAEPTPIEVKTGQEVLDEIEEQGLTPVVLPLDNLSEE